MAHAAPNFLPITLFGLHPLFWADVRLFACHVENLSSSPEAHDTHFLLGVHPIQKVELAGFVIGTKMIHAHSRVILSIDDGTGVVQATAYLRDDSTPAAVGDIVAVSGKLAFGWRNGAFNETCREVRVHSLRRLDTSGDLAAHWLETARLHAEQYSRGLRYWLPRHPAVDKWLLHAEAPASVPSSVGDALNDVALSVGPAAAHRLLEALRAAHPYWAKLARRAPLGTDDGGVGKNAAAASNADDADAIPRHSVSLSEVITNPVAKALPEVFTADQVAALLVPVPSAAVMETLLTTLVDASHILKDPAPATDAHGDRVTRYFAVHPDVTVAPLILTALRKRSVAVVSGDPMARVQPGLLVREIGAVVRATRGLQGLREAVLREAINGLVAAGKIVEVARERFALDAVNDGDV